MHYTVVALLNNVLFGDLRVGSLVAGCDTGDD